MGLIAIAATISDNTGDILRLSGRLKTDGPFVVDGIASDSFSMSSFQEFHPISIVTGPKAENLLPPAIIQCPLLPTTSIFEPRLRWQTGSRRASSLPLQILPFEGYHRGAVPERCTRNWKLESTE
ncbi:hypothetical protein TIFTF001_024106 [Ficus carica]|uniref:Uncharacterized protein n=1 Tax=Ficus carica TaxID=3494 RepID=A0AA88DFT9_FICCA|nr:hypothetical protein TIFTF001_024106 [Ficus carica]